MKFRRCVPNFHKRRSVALNAGTNEVRVVEHLYRWINWEIVEKSDAFIKTDSQTIEFRVQVPAGEEKVITYRVHYTW